MSNYHKTLGIKENASSEEVKKQFRALALKFHPDVNKEENAAAEFRKVREAYEALMQPQASTVEQDFTRNRHQRNARNSSYDRHDSDDALWERMLFLTLYLAFLAAQIKLSLAAFHAFSAVLRCSFNVISSNVISSCDQEKLFFQSISMFRGGEDKERVVTEMSSKTATTFSMKPTGESV